jgi:hypothetical protein
MGDMVRMLLANGACVHTHDGSAFRQACAYSNVDIAELLCEHGNMAPYCSVFLEKLVSAKARNQQPNQAVVDLLLSTHKKAIQSRYERVQESYKGALAFDAKKKKNEVYERTFALLSQNQSEFASTFRDPKPLHQSPQVNQVNLLLEALLGKGGSKKNPNRDKSDVKEKGAVEQLKQDGRTHALGVAVLVVQILEMYHAALQAYYTIGESKLFESMKASLKLHLQEELGRVSQVVNVLKDLVEPTADPRLGK